MEQEIIINKIISKIKEYAHERMNNVERGTETPKLAALILQKYGSGMIDAVAIFYDNPRTTDTIYKVLDEETSKIDEDWEKHNKERWDSRPADVYTMVN